MAILLYKLTCTATDKAYVGMTSRALHTRWLEHCERARQGVRHSRLYDAMRKYGLDAWTREIIATADTEEEARLYERTFIATLGTFTAGYNANEGGHGWSGPMPEAAKAKSRATQLGRKPSPEARAKMSAAKKANPVAHHLGDALKKGAANPRAHKFVIRFPDGLDREVIGLREFCRETGISHRHMKTRGRAKGYVVIARLGAVKSASMKEI